MTRREERLARKRAAEWDRDRSARMDRLKRCGYEVGTPGLLPTTRVTATASFAKPSPKILYGPKRCSDNVLSLFRSEPKKIERSQNTGNINGHFLICIVHFIS